MKRYRCSCGTELFFENDSCIECGRDIGFDPNTLSLFPLDYLPGGLFTQRDLKNSQVFKACEHEGRESLSCNWLLDKDDPNNQCLSCRLTRVIPLQNSYKNHNRWVMLEAAKRRLVYNILNHRLSYEDRSQNPEYGLVFDFLEDKRTNPEVDLDIVYTGHKNGVITINAAEADTEFRVMVRESMNERYRTVLGHYRHEIGHYFFDRLVQDTEWIKYFIYTFGNPGDDYQASLERYYANGPRRDWQFYHISAYASMHPLEDWAETWAHYLHMCDTLETASSFGLTSVDVKNDDFSDIMNKWMDLTVIMNSLTRSVGKPDAYPFVIKNNVINKLNFVHRVVLGASFT